MRGSGSTLSCDFLLFNINAFNNSQIFLSVLKMAATVYERDNCFCEVTRDPCPESWAQQITGNAFRISFQSGPGCSNVG